MSEAVKFETEAGTGNYVYVRTSEPKAGTSVNTLVLKVGDSIEGRIKEVRASQGPKSRGKPEYVISSFDGATNYVLTQSGNLTYRINAKGLKTGDAIAIIYKGKSKIAKGNYAGTEVNNFAVLGEDTSESAE